MSNHNRGFTLIEILIALFIFSILSIMLASALRLVINADIRTEESAYRLRDLELVLVLISRDVEQAIDRPILATNGREEAAFVGSPKAFALTHGGVADPTKSALQRTAYYLQQGMLWRDTWSVLDKASTSLPKRRSLLAEISELQFQYLGEEGKWKNNWTGGEGDDHFPHAIKMTLNLLHLGKINQIYVIPIKKSNGS